jgi:predicted metal-dependent hydrolase
MRGAKEPPALPLTQHGWAGNEDYLFGIDLFNAGYFWEAHAFWERLWAAPTISPEVRRFLRALVQVAAACLKARMGEKAGARKLLDRARLESFEGCVLGVDARALARKARKFVEEEGKAPAVELDTDPGAHLSR